MSTPRPPLGDLPTPAPAARPRAHTLAENAPSKHQARAAVRELRRVSADEVMAALNIAVGTRLHTCAHPVAELASARLARLLVSFDAEIARVGLQRAAAVTLERFGARWKTEGPSGGRGALLVLSNHPGAFDALLLMATSGRDDLAVLADDRAFLRALPNLCGHLLLIPFGAHGRRAKGLRLAQRHLERGGALLHFAAGCIEPDPAYWQGDSERLLHPWTAGTGALLRAAWQHDGTVRLATVSGVHSARAKRFVLTRLAEARGLNTVAFLLQVALPLFRDVHAQLAFKPHDAPPRWPSVPAADLAAQARRSALSALTS